MNVLLRAVRFLRNSMRSILIVLAVSGGFACNSTRSPSRVGEYSLAAIDNAPVPTVVRNDPQWRLEVLSGAITLFDDRTYRSELVSRVTKPSAITVDTVRITGTYSRSDTSLVLIPRGDVLRPEVFVRDQNTFVVQTRARQYLYRADANQR